jgi:tetraacyldisaccharide 4'-kinase
MIQNKLLQLLLLPFSLIYGITVSLRNMFYETGILRSAEFNIPVISVGNLSIGGTGKTPHIEYLVRLLNSHLNIATLSRGYKRKTRGFRFVQPNHRVQHAGDEPLVYKRKFPDLVVAVSESRVVGIPQILQFHPEIQVVLLDDAFQHRSVIPGLNILLTEYRRPFYKDYLLPSGRLREWRSAYRRADIIVVTKCPPRLSNESRNTIMEALLPREHQKVYFSYYLYGQPYFIFNSAYRYPLREGLTVLLIAAIAHTDYLLDYLVEEVSDVKTAYFEDHHFFSHHDMSQLKISFDRIPESQKIIVTTEKDAVRLAEHRKFILENKIPIYVLPIKVDFHFGQGEDFDLTIKRHLLNFQV